jgi:streptogramin lyase
MSFTYADGDPGGTGAVLEGTDALAYDGAGHLYLCNSTQILQVDAANEVTTLAQVDGNQAGSGYFETLAWSPAGFLWVPKTLMGAVIGKVAPGSPFVSVAGAPAQSGNLDGPGAQALFSGAGGIALDLAGNVLVADAGNSALRTIAPDGTVATLPVAGGSAPKSFMWTDPQGKLYFTDWFSQAVYCFANGEVTLVTGKGSLDAVQGITGDGAGNLFVTDDAWTWGDDLVQAITAAGTVTSLAGGFPGTADGQGASASFGGPHGITWSQGTLFVADTTTQRIRTVATDGTVATLAGSSSLAPGFADGPGVSARFAYPSAVAMAPDGNLFVADQGNHCLRMITPQGEVTTVVGSASAIGACLGFPGSLQSPSDLLVTPKGDLVILDGSGVLLYTAPEGH